MPAFAAIKESVAKILGLRPPIGMGRALRGLMKRGYQPDRIFDIGAADGGWARFALRVWPNAHVVCFEPLAERAAALAALRRRRPDRVTIHSIGVGDQDGEASLGVSADLWGSSFAYGGEESRTISVRTLDSLRAAGDIEQPAFIKVDVQGFERRVIAGGASVIAGADFFLMECAFRPFCADMQTLDRPILQMAELGFVPYEIVDCLRRPLDDSMGQCDILFVRRNHALMQDVRWSA